MLMKIRMIAVLLALFWANAIAAQPLIEPGTRFEIRHSYQTETRDDNGGSGSSRGHSTLIEQVVTLRDDGIELVYDEPDADERREWQLPVRVFKPANGPFELLNRAELEARVDPWLAKAKWTREICEKWVFTWNAFKIDCDPASALGIVEGYSLWQDNLREGAPFKMEGLLGSPRIRLERSDADGSVFVVSGDFDPKWLKFEKVKTEVIVAHFSGEPITEEQAGEKLADWQFSGTVTVRFTVDPKGLVLERWQRSETRIVEANGKIEVGTATSTLARRRLP